MTSGKIIESFLKENGFDGLFNTDNECACFLGDLFPCIDSFSTECRPGYKAKCTKDCQHDGAEFGDWHIQEGKAG